MKDILYAHIPSLALSDFTSGDLQRKSDFVESLGRAYSHIGFAAIKNHGLTDELTSNLYHAVKQFFTLPEKEKLKYEIPGIAGQRGYTGKGKENARGRSTGDLKEFYHIGQELAAGEPEKEEYPENVWPVELPELKMYGLEVYRTLENAGKHILQAIALYLGLDETYFDDKIENGNSILRPIHYFPVENPDALPHDAVRAAEHGDINLITLLMGASAEGLQVKRKDGKWIPITALAEQIVVNVGDMMERLTNNRLRSTIHRVVNPPREKMNTSRYSIPFFMHPRSEIDLNCLENCIDASHPKAYSDITAGEFLIERLREIGLQK